MEDLNTVVSESVVLDQLQKELSTFEIFAITAMPVTMLISSLLGFKVWLKVNQLTFWLKFILLFKLIMLFMSLCQKKFT